MNLWETYVNDYIDSTLFWHNQQKKADFADIVPALALWQDRRYLSKQCLGMP